MTCSREDQERAVAEIRRLRDTAAEARLLSGYEPEEIQDPGFAHPAVFVTCALFALAAAIGFVLGVVLV